MSEITDYKQVSPTTAFTMLNDNVIEQKFVNETKNKFTPKEKDEVLETIKQVCQVAQIARDRGIFATQDYIENTNNVFFRNMLTLLSKKWNDFTHTPAILYYWAKPMILSNSLHGAEFVKAILIYEGICMATCAGFAPEVIAFRLKELVGENVLLENIIK